MEILVVGSGGREHALVWKISKSPLVHRIYCAPGNPGIAESAQCVPIDVEDVAGLLTFAKEKRIDLTVVGPEGPLSKGIVDAFEAEGLRIFGARRNAAMIESSKSFAKELMEKYKIPTAAGRSFDDFDSARGYLEKIGAPVVVKADGLAAGKGVIICQSLDEAIAGLKLIMKDKAFGAAGERVLIESFLEGEEASFLVFTDGKTVLPLPTSQDHKAVYDGDKGPNTGGMGAYSPAPVIDRVLHGRIMNEIMIPTVRAMAAEGCPYKGVLYAGLMISRDQIRVLEFNGRFGDPEAQPLLMRIKGDIVPVLNAVIDGRLDQHKLEIDPRPAVCVVMASGGYPGAYAKGLPIEGIEAALASREVMVFHAGTSSEKGVLQTNGGRVLGVTALGAGIQDAIQTAYEAVNHIHWERVHYRKDIGQKGLDRLLKNPRVLIVMGSDSDLSVMEAAANIFKKFDVQYEMTVASAHRSPERATRLAAGAASRGIEVLIAGAGHAAHLAGVLAAHTHLPVVGVPIDSSCLSGLDALLSTVQMPPGIPVATMAIGKSGAQNAALFAIQVMAGRDQRLKEELIAYKEEMAKGVEKKAAALECLQ